MTLNLSWYGVINDANPHYAALSDNDKRFLCPADLLSDMSVPTLLLTTSMGFVSEESIPHILDRATLVHGWSIMSQLEDRSKKWGHRNLQAHLGIYLGVTSNLRTATSSEFFRRVVKMTRRDIDKMITQMNRMKKQNAA